ncbi:MAG: hypothetical protein QOF48_1794 [Verrucomicrobiota bacterium]|jgi:predicted secreted Zn-dependent protease
MKSSICRACAFLLAILVLGSATGVLNAQNTLLWSTNYYAITGNDTDELRDSMHRRAPWAENRDMASLVGLTTWNIEWSFTVSPTTTGCHCKSFTTRIALTNTLPRWLPPTNAPLELKRDWARFATALAQHEDGHSRLALAAVAEIHKQVSALGEDSDCDALKKKINDTARRTVDVFRKRDQDYDRNTNHGATQGAWLSGPARRPPASR